MRKSKRESITQSEYLQVVGLLTMSQHYQDKLRDVERALLNIVQEVDHDGADMRVWDGGHVTDAVGGEHNADQLLDRLNLKVAEDSLDD